MMNDTISFQEVVGKKIEELAKKIEEPSLPVVCSLNVFYINLFTSVISAIVMYINNVCVTTISTTKHLKILIMSSLFNFARFFRA